MDAETLGVLVDFLQGPVYARDMDDDAKSAYDLAVIDALKAVRWAAGRMIVLSPTPIRAFRLGACVQPTPAPEWFPSPRPDEVTGDGIWVETVSGPMLAHWGDWVVRGNKGDLYVFDDAAYSALFG